MKKITQSVQNRYTQTTLKFNNKGKKPILRTKRKNRAGSTYKQPSFPTQETKEAKEVSASQTLIRFTRGTSPKLTPS